MPKLEIIKPGLMTSIQDLGRNDLAYFAIPKSGVMDVNAAKIALLLLNLDADSPLIECTSIGPHILFHDDGEIAITGADFNWTLNDKVVRPNVVFEIKKGDLLKSQVAKDGLRGYIAVKGKLNLEKVYDSFSTYTNAKIGGHEGRLLKKGDVLEWENEEVEKVNYKTILIKPGPEFLSLSENAKQDFLSNIYKIGRDSNRMGIRLEGAPLKETIARLKNSVPVLPGFIQLPPSGLPIIVLQDGQTTGGYPRIAYVSQVYLSKLNQIPLGGNMKFVMKESI